MTHFRKRVGLSQEGLAYESGLARSFVSELERGIKQPSLQTLLILADTLKVKPSTLVLEVENRLSWKIKKT